MTLRNPYIDNQKPGEPERQRMDEQFGVHSKPLIARALRYLPLGQPIRVLDAGCGYGPAAIALQEVCRSKLNGKQRELESIILVDNNQALLDYAAPRAGVFQEVRSFKLDLSVPNSCSDLPKSNNLAIMSFVLAHQASSEVALANVASAMEPGGILLVVDADYRNAQSYGSNDLHTVVEDIRALVGNWKPAFLDDLARAAGFDLVEDGCADLKLDAAKGVSPAAPYSFVGLFEKKDTNEEVREAFANIRGGCLRISYLYRIYRKGA